MSLYDFTVTMVPILRCRAEDSSIVHYAKKDLFREWDDKKKVVALCGKAPVPGVWEFSSAGRPCNACHALAAKCVVHPAPKLSKPLYKTMPAGSAPADMSEIQGRLLASNYAGWCKRCKKPYEKGAVIWWKRDKGCHHEACGSWAPDPPATEAVAESVTKSASS